MLGPVEVDGVPVRGREAAVLAALALRVPRGATVDELIDAVWGEDPPLTAPKSLQNAVSKLRRLDGVRIETTSAGYRLDADTDLQAAEAMAAAGDPEGALELWRGDPTALPEGARIRVDELRASLEEDAVHALLRRGQSAAAVAALEAGVADRPYRERRWVLLVQALAAEGRQAEALRAVQRCRQVLGEELGLEPGPEILAAERAVVAVADTTAKRPPPAPTTSFVGRDEEVAVVRRHLTRHRLVTLVGPGGVGKTRVALAVISGDDAVFVDLAPVAGPDRVWEAAAAAVGVPTLPGSDIAEAATDAIGTGLVVLDNCEHVIEAAADVAHRLRATVLATSREPLGLPDELVVSLRPLDQQDGARLFVDRARSAGATDVGDLDAIAEVCRRLDGLPLAIELAAARAPALAADQLVRRLDDRFALLDDRARRGDPRHRALRAVVDWSYELLDTEERLLFDRLSVFRAPFTLESVESVTSDDALPRGAVAPAMTGLVRASMVTVEGGDSERRYRLLETFRAYAEARLTEPDLWRGRHADWVAAFAAEAGPQLSGSAQLLWFPQVAAIFDDVEHALAHCATHGRSAQGLQIASDLFHFWMGRARRGEGLRWLELFGSTATDVPALDRCRALYGAAMIGMMTDVATVDRLAEVAACLADDRDARAVADAIAAVGATWRGDEQALAQLTERAMPVLDGPQHDGTLPQVWDARAWLACMRGDIPAARAWWQRATARLDQQGDRHLYGAWLAFDADLAVAMGQAEEATAIASESLDIARAVFCRSCEASALASVVITADAPGAAELDDLRQAVSWVVSIGEITGVLLICETFAALQAVEDPDRAAWVIGAAQSMREQTGHRWTMPGRTVFAEPHLRAARERIGGSRWDAAVENGRRLSYREMCTLMLETST